MPPKKSGYINKNGGRYMKLNKLTIFGIALMSIGMIIIAFLFFMFIGRNYDNYDQWDFFVTQMFTQPAYAMVVGGILATIIGLSLDRIEEIRNGKKQLQAPRPPQQNPPSYP